MTDERAMEILDPKHREHYESIEPVNEACRIGMNAIKRVKQIEKENTELKTLLTEAGKLLLEYCEGDFCKGDMSVGIFPCPMWRCDNNCDDNYCAIKKFLKGEKKND